MNNLNFEKALVVGGSTGCGKEIALKLSELGVATSVVARSEKNLQKLQTEEPLISTIVADASEEGFAEKILRNIAPDALFVCASYAQEMKPFFEQTWDEFSMPWTVDTKIAHAFLSASIRLPLKSGASVVNFSSGAGISGSRLSGGYAGAKRMQHFITLYAQQESDIRNLGISFYSAIPKQLIEETTLGISAATAYGEASGKSYKQVFANFPTPLTPKKVANYTLEFLLNEATGDDNTFFLTGSGYIPESQA